MTLMERPVGLILSFLCVQWCGLIGVHGLSETAQLEISGGPSGGDPIQITTECKCEGGDVMKFTVDGTYLPDILTESDLLPNAFNWDQNNALCDGDLEYKSGKLHVTFSISRKCGVNMPSGKTPKIVALSDGVAFHGHVMEADLQFVYPTHSGTDKHLTAWLACACPSSPPPTADPCSPDGKFQLEKEFDCAKVGIAGHVESCTITETNVVDCSSTSLHSSLDGNPVVAFDIDLLNGECDAVADRGTFFDLTLKYKVEYVLNLGALAAQAGMQKAEISEWKELFHTCTKAASWSEFGEWSNCLGYCGIGHRQRIRTCNNGIPGLPGCPGSASEKEECELGNQCKSPCSDGTTTGTDLNGQLVCKCDDEPQVRYVLYPNHLIPESQYEYVAHAKTLRTQTHFLAKMVPFDDTSMLFIVDAVASFVIGHSGSVLESAFAGRQKIYLQVNDDVWTFDQVYPVDVEDLSTLHHILFSRTELSAGLTITSVTEMQDVSNLQVTTHHTDLFDKDFWCRNVVTRRSTDDSQVAFAPHCPAVLEHMGCDKTCSSDMVNSQTIPTAQQVMNLLNNKNSASSCSDALCDPDTLVANCKLAGGELVTLNQFAKCGSCGPCNQVEFICKNGVAEYNTSICGETTCPACTSDDVTTGYQPWSECDAACDGGERTRSRKTKPIDQLATLNCAIGDLKTYQLTETEQCNLKCCGWSESWSEWVVISFKDADNKCRRKRTKTTHCDDVTKSPGSADEYDDTCILPQVTTTCDGDDHVVCDESTTKDGSTKCATDEGKVCCKVSEVKADPWSACVGKCAYAHRTRIEDKCGISSTVAEDAFCHTGNDPCMCKDSSVVTMSKYDCENVENAFCVEKSDGSWTIVTRQCKVKDEFKNKVSCEVFEEDAPCEVTECKGGITTNCCRQYTCEVTNGHDCNQVSRKCFDQFAVAIQTLTEEQNCCTTLPPCDATQIATVCPACDSTFPECLRDPKSMICASANVECAHDPDQCQCGEFACDADHFDIPELTNAKLESAYVDLPEKLYGDQLLFFLGMNGDNFNRSECSFNFDRTNPDESLNISVSFEAARKCNAVEITTHDETKFTVNLFVDGIKADHEQLGTHTKFAEISCVIPKPQVLQNTIAAIPRMDPIQIVQVIQSNQSELKMELASDPLFENRLDEDGVLLGNALMVGEYVYARIKADEPISIEGCSIHSLDNTMSEVMIDDGCVKPTMKSAFNMKFLETSDENEIQIMWQNFYFRKLSTPRQRVSYVCSVKPCIEQPCRPSCDKPIGRKRRSWSDETDEEIRQARLKFWIDVYKTTQELEKSKIAVESFVRSRRMAVIMSRSAMITTGLLLGLVFLFACWLLHRAFFNNQNRSAEVGLPKILRKAPQVRRSNVEDNSNNNLGTENPAFDFHC